VPGKLHRTLKAYTACYRETIGQPIELWPRVVQVAPAVHGHESGLRMVGQDKSFTSPATEVIVALGEVMKHAIVGYFVALAPSRCRFGVAARAMDMRTG